MSNRLAAYYQNPAVLLFVLLFGTYAYFYQGSGHNEAARFDQMRAMAYDHALTIDNYWFNTADVIHYPPGAAKTHVYPNKAPGGTFIGLLPFFVFSKALRILQLFHISGWATWELAAYFTVLCTVSAFSALAAVATYYVVREITHDSYAAILAVIAVWLGTLCFPYSTLFFSHQLTASLLSLAFALLFWSCQRETTVLIPAIAGLLLGCAVIAEYPTALLAGIISGYYLLRVASAERNWRLKLQRLLALAIGGAIPGLLLVIYNWVAFGKLIYVPLEAYAATGTPFETYKHGILGFQWRGLAAFFHALLAITIESRIGMLYVGFHRWMVYGCSPVLWLVIPGMVAMWFQRKVRREAIMVLIAIVTYILFVTSYGTSEYDWAGGSYFGSRHLVPLLPFLGLPLGFAARRFRMIFLLLLAVSVFYALLATAVEPRLSYPAENPARDILWPEFLRGHLAQNTAALFDRQGQYLTADSIAFNWAKLLRVRGPYQLVPLMLFWALVGGMLAVTVAPARRSLFRRITWPRAVPSMGVAIFCCFIMAAPVAFRALSAPARHRKHGLTGYYYRNATWNGKPADVHVDPRIDFDWSKTMPLQPPFTIEWNGGLLIEEAGDYTFSLMADDGALLEIDSRPVINLLHGPAFERRSMTIQLEGGTHAIRVRYINALFGGTIRLWWRNATRPEQIIPEDALIPKAPAAGTQRR